MLKNVKELHATWLAFAALREDSWHVRAGIAGLAPCCKGLKFNGIPIILIASQN